jgi:hypothetical protein
LNSDFEETPKEGDISLDVEETEPKLTSDEGKFIFFKLLEENDDEPLNFIDFKKKS